MRTMQRSGLGVQDGVHELLKRGGQERRVAGRALVQHAAEGPDVGRRGKGRLLVEQLGRHVARRGRPPLQDTSTEQRAGQGVHACVVLGSCETACTLIAASQHAGRFRPAHHRQWHQHANSCSMLGGEIAVVCASSFPMADANGDYMILRQLVRQHCMGGLQKAVDGASPGAGRRFWQPPAAR